MNTDVFCLLGVSIVPLSWSPLLSLEPAVILRKYGTSWEIPHCLSSKNIWGGRQCYYSPSKYYHKGEGNFSPPEAEIAVFIYCAPDGPSLQVPIVSDGKTHVTQVLHLLLFSHPSLHSPVSPQTMLTGLSRF